MANFESFKKDLLHYLKKESKKCNKIIDNNAKLIESCLSSEKSPQLKTFVNDFNDVVLDPKIKKFKIFEGVLKHRLFTTVLAQFRESDVLVRAVKNYNDKAIKWLLDMDMNFGAQDEEGMTALMYAVKNENYFKNDFYKNVVKTIMKTNGQHIHLTDNKGNTALFYAVLAKDNFDNINNFLKYKDVVDCNHINNDNENLLLFACRYSRLINTDYLVTLKKFNCSDPNITNNEGKTAAMYLAQRHKCEGLKFYLKDYNIDPNYKNKFGNTLVSEFAKRYYKFYSQTVIENSESVGLNLRPLKLYAVTLKTLIDLGCDVKSPIDEDGNTLVTILVKLRDELSLKYLLDKGIIDIAVDNKNLPSKKYPEIDVSNPHVQKNLKSYSKWLTEVYYPNGTLNTHKLGVLLFGHNTNYSYY